MGWRDTLRPDEVYDLQVLEARLRERYNEDDEYERRKIIARGHSRATLQNRLTR